MGFNRLIDEVETVVAPTACAAVTTVFEAAFCGESRTGAPGFSSPGHSRASLLRFNRARLPSAMLHARTTPQAPLESRQGACRWTPLDKLEERMFSSSRRPKA